MSLAQSALHHLNGLASWGHPVMVRLLAYPNHYRQPCPLQLASPTLDTSSPPRSGLPSLGRNGLVQDAVDLPAEILGDRLVLIRLPHRRCLFPGPLHHVLAAGAHPYLVHGGVEHFTYPITYYRVQRRMPHPEQSRRNRFQRKILWKRGLLLRCILLLSLLL